MSQAHLCKVRHSWFGRGISMFPAVSVAKRSSGRRDVLGQSKEEEVIS